MVGLLLLAPAVLSAAVNVDNVSLKKQGSFTEITVYATGTFDFNHQIVEPGAGKPYRVVLDLKDATHKLPHYNFNDLPSETITSIRTSQYSVSPERVVRVVLDVKGKVTYKARSDKNAVTLVVATPNDKEFPFWCAQPLSEEKKLQLALAEAKPAPSESAPQETEAFVEETPVLVSSLTGGDPDDGPRIPSGEPKKRESTSSVKYEDSPLETFAFDSSKEQAVTEEKATKKKETKQQQVEENSARDVARQSARKAAEEKPTTSVSKTPVDRTPVVSKIPLVYALADGEETSKEEQPEEITRPAKAVTPVQKTTADGDKATQTKPEQPLPRFGDSAANSVPAGPAINQDSGSKGTTPEAPRSPKPFKDDEQIYRMNPDKPTKTKGTLADRFPKRKVVKYESWGRVDPFSVLVDRAKAGSKPGEIPDVETLRLVGVLNGMEGSSALLEDLEGYGYILKDGDPVKNGYVVQIGESKVIFQIKEYGWSRTIALKMETD